MSATPAFAEPGRQPRGDEAFSRVSRLQPRRGTSAGSGRGVAALVLTGTVHSVGTGGGEIAGDDTCRYTFDRADVADELDFARLGRGDRVVFRPRIDARGPQARQVRQL